jgi:propionate catabolism operon transcriptional regulator
VLVTGYDIMRGVKECIKLFQAKKIAVILSESIVVEKEFIENTFNIELTVFKTRDHVQVNEMYEKVKTMDIDAIVGGLAVHRMANRDNFHSVAITVGQEACKLVINEAFNVANAIIEERKKNELFKIILESAEEGIIAVDNLGVINAFNQIVYKILNISPKKELMGNTVSNVHPVLESMLNSVGEAQETNIIKNINTKMVVINRMPIVVEEKILGTVFLFQNLDKLQKTEIDIRQKLSKKGLLAKYDFENIIGESEAVQKTIRVAKKYADAQPNVLIIGETGTGKELFAQSIHKNSLRSNHPFVAINCAALPENLLESELFGYVDGAFTGAAKGGKAGLFELAHKGTLFLDEVAELPLGLQAKLLRVLQEKEIRKLGDDKIIPVEVRIIAASNVDLQLKVRENTFRQDLLYRLDILRLSIPPLRERKSDIKEIANNFLASFSGNSKYPIHLTEEATIEFLKYDWPGNIRELRNICERLTVLCTDSITKDDVMEVFNSRQIVRDTEQKFIVHDKIVEGITSNQLTRKEIAELLGISRTTLWRKTKKINEDKV